LRALGGEAGPDDVRAIVLGFYKPAILRLCTVAKPVIGAINGAAAGAGAALALACDLRILGDDAYLLMAFSNIGLVPDAGASWFLARQVGYSRAYQLAIEGERIPAGRCLELGLANRIAPAADLVSAAQEWAQRLAARPTVALGLTKRAMHEAAVRDLEDLIHLEADLQAVAVTTADHREGVAAFLAKRTPQFQGR
jgi:2-(1,2-epoxy-1,2-dihydrophenyl)acetyl-CoA isomerase